VGTIEKVGGDGVGGGIAVYFAENVVKFGFGDDEGALLETRFSRDERYFHFPDARSGRRVVV